MKNFITIALVLIVTKGFAKTNIQPSSLNCSGYVETYYTYDFGHPSNYNRTAFIYSFNRYNEVNLNLGFVKTACDYFMQDSIMWQ